MATRVEHTNRSADIPDLRHSRRLLAMLLSIASLLVFYLSAQTALAAAWMEVEAGWFGLTMIMAGSGSRYALTGIMDIETSTNSLIRSMPINKIGTQLTVNLLDSLIGFFGQP